MSGALPFYFDGSERRFSGYLRGVWPSQSDRSLGVAGGSSLSSLLWADSLFLSASKGSGHWVMYTPFLLLLVSPRYRLALPDGEDASDGVSLGASLPSLAWLSRGSSGGGVMITSCDSILVSKNHFHDSVIFIWLLYAKTDQYWSISDNHEQRGFYVETMLKLYMELKLRALNFHKEPNIFYSKL